MLWMQVVGQGHPLVLLHPVGTSGDIWWQHIPRLARSFRVLAVDLPGHGRSPKPKEPVSIEGMAEALYETLHKMSLFPAHVIGLSLGGMVAQMLVVRRPLAVASLVLCDTICEATPAMADFYEERAKAVERGGMAAIVQPMLARCFSPGFLEQNSDVVMVVEKLLLAADPVIDAQSWRAIAKFDVASQIRSISHPPALVINGSLDVSIPPDMGKRLSGLFQAEIAELEGCAHLAPVEAPDQFIAHLESFLLSNEQRVKETY